MTGRVPELRALGLEVPRALDELVQRLLRKDPRDRYQSAEAVLLDLDMIEEALENGERDPDLVIGLHDRRCTVAEAAFVGRSRELDAVDAQLLTVYRGTSSAITVECESGGGKTRLLDEVAQRARREGFWVLRGQATNEVAAQPFQLLDGVLSEVISAASADLSLGAKLQQYLGDQVDAIQAALPACAKALGWTKTAMIGPEAFGEARSVIALTELLSALGSMARPALIILDDCQWADEPSVKLIARWCELHEERAPAIHRVLLVIAYRSEEVAEDHALRRPRTALQLTLSRFEPEDIRRLIESMAGPLPDEAVEVVTRLADGSPFMASAVLRGLVESAALVPGAAGWHIEPLALADLQSSRHAASFLSHRIDLLPPAAVSLLTVGAILGKDFDLHTAITLANQDPLEVLQTLNLVRQRHLIWMRTTGTHCVFVHDKVRAALLDRLSVEERRDLHLRAARHLKTYSTPNAFELAYHFDAAGDFAAALGFALHAAHQARSQHSLEIAEQQYRIAQRGAETADRATQYRVYHGLGDVLMLRGHYVASAELFEKAAMLADAPSRKLKSAANKANWPSNVATWSRPRSRSSRRCVCWALGAAAHGDVRRALPLGSHGAIRAHGRTDVLGRSTQEVADARAASRMAIVQQVGAWLLVRSQQDSRALDAPAWHEPGRALSTDRRAGTVLFRTCAGNDAGALLQSRHYVRTQVARDSQVARRFVGAGAIVALLEHRALYGITICRVRGEGDRSDSTARTHGRLLGSAHRTLSSRRRVASHGQPARSDRTRPAKLSFRHQARRRAGIGHQLGCLGSRQPWDDSQRHPESRSEPASPGCAGLCANVARARRATCVHRTD